MKYILVSIGFFLTYTSLLGQTIVERTDEIYIDYGYPKLVINDRLSFNDNNNNQAIDPGETATVGFFIDNVGTYPAKNVVIKAVDKSNTPGLILEEEKFIGNIPQQKMDLFVQGIIKGDSALEAGKADLVFQVFEKDELVETLDFSIATTGLIEGKNLELVENLFYSEGRIVRPGQSFRLRLTIKNSGTVPVQNVSFDFLSLQHVLEQFKRQEVIISEMQPGEIRDQIFEFFLGVNYKDKVLPIEVIVKGSNEKEGTQISVSSMVDLN